MLKIGLDIHGVVDLMPKFFAELTKILVSTGNEVHILTGRSINDKLFEEINKYDIHYTHLFSIIDYHKKLGTPIYWEDDDNPWIDNELWNKAKANYCEEHEIQLMLDDSFKYSQYFNTPYAVLLPKNFIFDNKKHAFI